MNRALRVFATTLPLIMSTRWNRGTREGWAKSATPTTSRRAIPPPTRSRPARAAPTTAESAPDASAAVASELRPRVAREV